MRVKFIFLRSMMSTSPHDDREGHHYYTPPSARLSCIVVMTLAVIMGRGGLHRAGGHHASAQYMNLHLPYVHKMPSNSCRCRHGWTNQMSTSTAPLTSLKVAVAGGSTALPLRKIVAIHSNAHTATGLTPLKARGAEDIGDTLCFGLATYLGRSGDNQGTYRWSHPFPLHIASSYTQVFQ